MRFHVVSLPHTQATAEYLCCAYTQKTRKFCMMMRDLGHDVFLYASDDCDVEGIEHISCISKAEQRAAIADKHYTAPEWDTTTPHWKVFNTNVAKEISARFHPRDFVCVIGGVASAPMTLEIPKQAMVVEYGIGYAGVFAPYRVFESYAWMHAVYGQNSGAHQADGRWFDAVIPNYFDLNEFEFQETKGDYYLYLGRITPRKGIDIVAAMCEARKLPLVLAGPGEWKGYGNHIGEVGIKERAKLLAGARALLCPTKYLEPFGGVAVEAMLSGTPVICSDWGAFTETVIQGVTGYRCRTLREFCDAADNVMKLNPWVIRLHAERYSMQNVAQQYEAYFKRLMTLWGKGWYEL